ncbi:MAG: MBL fold metallo-hydrolase [Rhodocyclaceae bacterium]
MRFASLGSGSRGNALIVEAGVSRLLLDCGFSPREAKLRLGRLGLEPEDVSGLVITHEHSDHVGGAVRFALRYGLTLWLTCGTLSALQAAGGALPRTELIVGDQPFAFGDIEVLPYPVPHDAREPVQFVFCDGRSRLGVLTDAGCVTPHIENCLRECAALVLECNHDSGMLSRGAYPQYLKARIAGRFGHLDNEAAAALLAAVASPKLEHVVAAHLSEKNNRPELARQSLAGALGCAEEWISVAQQQDGLPWRALCSR